MTAGRPTIMTEIVVKKLEEAFALGCTDLEACFYAEISKQTLYNYQDAHPEFVGRKEALKERPVFLARQSVIKQMEEDGDLALKYLERKRKDEFSTKTEQDHNVTVRATAPITLNEKEIIPNVGKATPRPDAGTNTAQDTSCFNGLKPL